VAAVELRVASDQVSDVHNLPNLRTFCRGASHAEALFVLDYARIVVDRFSDENGLAAPSRPPELVADDARQDRRLC
jgi:hypothetical protein